MFVETRASLAKIVAKKFRQQYTAEIARETVYPWGSPKNIADALDALGPNPEPDAVEKVLGTRLGNWIKPTTCNECRKESPCVVQLGEEPDWESQTAWVCLPCLQEAVKLATGEA